MWLVFLVAALTFNGTVAQQDSLTNNGIVKCLNDTGADFIFPWDTQYAKSRRLPSLFFDRYPFAVTYPTNESQIVKIVHCGRQYGLKITPRCGGHNNEGASVINGQITVDLTRMNLVNVSADFSTATVQSGALAGHVVAEVYQQSGGIRALPVGQRPYVGFAGLLLGGGYGFSTRDAGLTCDRLISLRAITTNGSIITATGDNQHKDLFWASCGGGGGNFAIILDFTLKTIDVSIGVTKFFYTLPLKNLTETALLIDYYQDWSIRIDPKCTPNLSLMSIFDVPTPTKDLGILSIVGWCHANLTEFYQILNGSGLNESTPLKISGFKATKESMIDAAMSLSFTKSTNLTSWVNSGTDSDANAPGKYFKYKSYLLEEKLPIQATELLLNYALKSGRYNKFEFQALGGASSAFAAVDPQATAFPHRNARHCLILAAVATNATQATSSLGNTDKVWQELAPYVPGAASYVNQMDAAIPNYEESYYGLSGYPNITNSWSTIDLLTQVKITYDSANVLTNGIQPCCGILKSTTTGEDYTGTSIPTSSSGALRWGPLPLAGFVVLSFIFMFDAFL